MELEPKIPDPATSANASADLLDYSLIARYAGLVLGAPRRHWLLALSCFVATVLIALVALWALPKRYRVEGTMLAQRTPVMGSLSNPGLNREGDAPTRAARELVLRRENLVSLCKHTDFARRYLETRAPAVRFRDWLYRHVLRKQRTEEQLLEALVDALEARLWVTVTNEGAVIIAFEWSDDQAAYRIVDAAMQSFLEARHASEVSIVSDAVAILEGYAARLQNQMGEMVSELEEKERRLRNRRTPRPPITTPPRVSRDEDLVRLESTLTSRRRALSDLEEFRQRRMAELQTQLGQQLTLYAPQHPAVASTRQHIETLSATSPQVEDLRAEIRNLERDVRRRGGSTGERDVARNEWASVPSRVLEDDPRVEYERGQLRLLFRQYSSLIERLDSARIELETARAAFKHRYSVISPPQMPKRPVRPKPPLVLTGAVIAGVFLGFFAAAAVDIRSGLTLYDWQIERAIGVPVVASLRR